MRMPRSSQGTPEKLDQCLRHNGNRPRMKMKIKMGMRTMTATCLARIGADGRSCRKMASLTTRYLSCCAPDKMEVAMSETQRELGKLANFTRMPKVHVAYSRLHRVRAAICPGGRPYKQLASLLRKSSITIPNLVFISLICCLAIEHSVTTTRAIMTATVSQQQLEHSWRHYEQTSDSQGGFTSRRLIRLATSPVYKSIDEDETTMDLGQQQQQKEKQDFGDNETKILTLHGQLNALRRQLERELRKSKTRVNDTNQQEIGFRSRQPRPTLLGSPCLATSDCSQTVKFSHCKLDTFTCSCLDQHVELNSSTCLPPVLLGYECTIDAQCQQKVPESVCQLGKCACRLENFVPYRKNKCLPAAKVNHYCLADDQCHLSDKHSYCKWKIPNVYGICTCPPNYNLLTDAKGGGLRCAPRLGDTCLSDRECQLMTKNSICSAQSTINNDAPTSKNTPSRRQNSWLSSSASNNKCTCVAGFVWSRNHLECIVQEVTQAGEGNSEQRVNDTAATTQGLDCHKYETVIADTPGGHQPQVIMTPVTLNPENSPIELAIKFVPLVSPTSTATSTSTTTERWPSSTTTTTPPTTTTTTPAVVVVVAARGNDTIVPGKFKVSSLGKPCASSQECHARDPHSDCIGGICECLAPSERCAARSTGCHPDTFQCRNGQCISWYFVCDKFRNCDDGSDEEACQSSSRASGCPRESFQCRASGACLTRAKVCNGKRDCPDGSDEFGCKLRPVGGNNNNNTTGAVGGCPPNSFACYNGQCLPAYVFCNAVEDCADASDEDERFCGRGSPGSTSPAPQPQPKPALSVITTTTTSEPPQAHASASPQGPTESPLVRTDRASIERLMAAFALTQRTPEKPARKAKMVSEHHQQQQQPATKTTILPADECPSWAFTCRNGKCRSSAILCSGVDGCGDNSDEDRCEVCQCEPPPPLPPTTTKTAAPNPARARRHHKAPAWTGDDRHR